MNGTRIDVHAHYLTPFYLEALKSAGLDAVDGFPLPRWSLEACLANMDRHNTRVSILSVSSPGVAFADPPRARTLASEMNEAAAGFVAAHPSRLGALAVLPLPDVDASLEEIEHALTALDMDGVGLLTNYGGVYLGDPRFAPIFDALDARGATVHIHPTQPRGFADISLGYPAPVLEYPFDTTRTVNSLVMSGALRRWRRMKLIVSHGGGAVPYLAARCAPFLAQKLGGLTPDNLAEVGAELRGLYYDLTASTSAASFAALRTFVPASQLLWGFDFPFMPPATIPIAIADLEAAGLGPAARAEIDHGNALKLFPRLASA